MISEEALKEFIAIYKRQFGKEISQGEAGERGMKLTRLIELIYKPMTENEYKQVQDRRRETGDLETQESLMC